MKNKPFINSTFGSVRMKENVAHLQQIRLKKSTDFQKKEM